MIQGSTEKNILSYRAVIVLKTCTYLWIFLINVSYFSIAGKHLACSTAQCDFTCIALVLQLMLSLLLYS